MTPPPTATRARRQRAEQRVELRQAEVRDSDVAREALEGESC
jgi:hypothetical protein